jgi:hypothetical protein
MVAPDMLAVYAVCNHFILYLKWCRAVNQVCPFDGIRMFCNSFATPLFAEQAVAVFDRMLSPRDRALVTQMQSDARRMSRSLE